MGRWKLRFRARATREEHYCIVDVVRINIRINLKAKSFVSRVNLQSGILCWIDSCGICCWEIILFSKWSILLLVNSTLIVYLIGGIPVSILRASMEMVIYSRVICKRKTLCIENCSFWAALVKLLPYIAAPQVIIFSTIVKYQIFSIWFSITKDLVANFKELW